MTRLHRQRFDYDPTARGYLLQPKDLATAAPPTRDGGAIRDTTPPEHRDPKAYG
jgi:hypothetical protein